MRLYRNRGDGTFEDVTQRAGLAIPLYGMGMAAADYDNDGDTDLSVTGYQRNFFFINNGDGTFTEASRRVGLRQGQWGSGAAFFDYDRDGLLDLVISNYVEWTPELERGLDCTYGTPAKDYCPVRYFKGQGLTLYHNRGDGTFEDVTQRAGVASEGARAFAPAILDFNEDGWPDILVASDGTPSLLWRNRGDGTFAEVGMQTGLVLDAGGAAYAGMGIDVAYPTNDGQLCIAIGNFVGEPTTLHCRVRQGDSYHPELYTEVSAWAGIGRPTLRYVTFGLFFFDADLDGFEDLFMVNGHVVDETRLRHVPRAQPPQLFRNLGTGRFAEIVPPAGSGLDQLLVGRGAAYADYDGDGDLDILVSQNQGPALLLRNDTPRQAHYLRVHLQGTQSNRDGIGAEVRVHTGDQVLRQMVRTGRSYYSQNELLLTFGLGQATHVARMEIVWPSGTVDSLSGRAGRYDPACRRREGPVNWPLCRRSRREAASNWALWCCRPPLACCAPLRGGWRWCRQHCQRPAPVKRIWPTRRLALRPIMRSAMRKPHWPLRRRGRCSPLNRYPTATWPICTGARASQTRQPTWCGPWPRSCPMRTSSSVWARAMKSPGSWGWLCCSTARRPVLIPPSPARATTWGVSC